MAARAPPTASAAPPRPASRRSSTAPIAPPNAEQGAGQRAERYHLFGYLLPICPALIVDHAGTLGRMNIMADRSPIEWTHATWNPTTGCDRVSAGCDHCYALDLAVRLKAMGSTKYQRDGDPRTSGPGFGLAVHRASLNVPRQWRAPRMIFVNSMSDLSVWLPGRPSGSCWVFPLVSALLAGWFGCATRVGHGWSGVLFEVAVVDPACEDAEGGEVLECALFWPVGSVLVCGWVADPGEAALGEGPQCSVAVFDRQVGGVGRPSR